MRITYDESVDAMYIKLNEKLVYKTSKKITDDVLIDYSKDGKVMGVEVLDASKNALFPLNKKTTIPIEFQAQV